MNNRRRANHTPAPAQQPVTIPNLQALSAQDFEARLRAEWDRLEAALAQHPGSKALALRLHSVDARLAAVEGGE